MDKDEAIVEYRTECALVKAKLYGKQGKFEVKASEEFSSGTITYSEYRNKIRNSIQRYNKKLKELEAYELCMVGTAK